MSPATMPERTPAWRRATPPPWALPLLWMGPAACLAGVAVHQLFAHWVPARTVALLVLAAAAMGMAWAIRRMARCSWASALLLPWGVALAIFGGVLPLVAGSVLAVTALAVGGCITGRAQPVLACSVGLAVLAGVLGWLLPLPVHHRVVYLVSALAIVVARRRALGADLRCMAAAWRAAVAASPRAAAWSVLLLGLASTACWVPSMQYDDLAYHLRLPWQLQMQGHYPLNAGTHAWALAPWATDVLQAAAQVMAAAEARGAVNLLWLALGASGVWRLAAAMGADGAARWWTVTLFASLPATAALALGMQTEPAAAALLVWLAVLVMEPASPRALFAAAVLAGGLAATKLSGVLMATVLVSCWLYRHAGRTRPSALAGAALVAVVVGGSSYAYAAIVAGNPVLPLFNAWFRSPFYPPIDFVDVRWQSGVGPWLPWNLAFHTDRYQEAFPGGFGLVPVALCGAWCLALLRPATRLVAAASAALALAMLLPVQYARYLYPALVLALPALVVATLSVDPRRGRWLLAGLCTLHVVFQANGNWMLRTGAVKDVVMAAGRDEASFATYAPERQLLAMVRATSSDHGNVLSLDLDAPMVAEMGSRGRSVSHYDPALAAEAVRADTDRGGAAWAALLRSHGIGHVLLRPAALTPAQRAGLHAAGASRRARRGEAEWWTLVAAAGTEP